MLRKFVGDNVSFARSRETLSKLHKYAPVCKYTRRHHTSTPETQQQHRGIHNMHTVGLLKEDFEDHLSQIPTKSSQSLSPVSVPVKDRPKATSGDYCSLGTDSAEYHHVDTNPESVTEPYEHPRLSGKQLRYGGMPQVAKEGVGWSSGSG